jgi:hypothetical protein
MRYSKLGACLAIAAGLAAAIAAAPTGAQVVRGKAASCARVTNIEAIVDDSGSMRVTDPNRLRVQGLDLLINSLSPGTLLGAVEFGGSFFSTSTPSADTVFKPESVGANASAMKSALNQKIHADNGGTDYNAAFAQSDADNPNAGARIFLTDGGHDIGTYNNGHLVHRVPTYVIGFSPGVSLPADQNRLKQIASDTGGKFYPLADSTQLQSVINSIGAALTCQTPPQAFTDTLSKGQSRPHAVAVGAATKSVQIALTWASPKDAFTVFGLKLVSHGRTIATSARVKRLAVTLTKGSTFVLLKVTRLRKGTLQFRVKATRVGSGHPKVKLTSQVSQRR